MGDKEVSYEFSSRSGRDERIHLEIDEDIEDQFTYHSPTIDMSPKFRNVSDILMLAAQVIRDNCPDSANTTIALQHLVDARMRANAAIALEGRGFKRKNE